MAPATTAPETMAVAANCAWLEEDMRDSQVDIVTDGGLRRTRIYLLSQGWPQSRWLYCASRVHGRHVGR